MNTAVYVILCYTMPVHNNAMGEKCDLSLIFGSSLIKYPQAFPPGMAMPIKLGNLVQKQSTKFIIGFPQLQNHLWRSQKKDN